MGEANTSDEIINDAYLVGKEVAHRTSVSLVLDKTTAERRIVAGVPQNTKACVIRRGPDRIREPTQNGESGIRLVAFSSTFGATPRVARVQKHPRAMAWTIYQGSKTGTMTTTWTWP